MDRFKLSPTEQTRFLEVSKNIDCLLLRLCVPTTDEDVLNKRKQTLSRLGIEDVDLFVEWFNQLYHDRLEEIKSHRRELLTGEFLGGEIDNLDTHTSPDRLEKLDKRIAGRNLQRVRLGTTGNYQVRLRFAPYDLEQTYLSESDRYDDGVEPEAEMSAEGSRFALLLSLYRNSKGVGMDNSVVSSGSEFSESSDDSMTTGKSNYSEAGYEDDSSTPEISESTSDIQQPSSWSRADSTWPSLIATNVLRKFMPIGRLQTRTVAHAEKMKDDTVGWSSTPFMLVCNMDDKRPWIVFNPRWLTDVGDEIFIPPGKRLARFCGSTHPISHARLTIHAPELNWPQPENSFNPAFGQGRPPVGYWKAIFANRGDINRMIEINTIFQDASIAIGTVLWDDTANVQRRPGDQRLAVRGQALNSFLDKFTMANPPHPGYANEPFPFDHLHG